MHLTCERGRMPLSECQQLASLSKQRGYTPRELARLLRVSPDRIRAWIIAGELGAVNTAATRCGKPRFVILPHHLEAWEKSRRVGTSAVPGKRKQRSIEIEDFYPD